mgnify:CR=1 FL=1
MHKNTVMACVRVPGPDGGRTSTVRRFRTFTDSLRELRAWLIAEVKALCIAIGVVDFDFGNYEVHLTSPLARVDSGLTRETTVAAGANEREPARIRRRSRSDRRGASAAP